MEYLGLSISYFSVFSSPFQIVQVWSLSCASFLGHVQKCRQSLCYRIFIIVKKQKSDSLSKDAGHRRDFFSVNVRKSALSAATQINDRKLKFTAESKYSDRNPLFTITMKNIKML